MTTPSIPLKRCTKCGEEKPATPEYFHKTSHNKCGLRAVCKVCRVDIQRRYYEENAEDICEYGRRYRIEHLESARDYQRRYCKENADYIRKRSRQYRVANSEKVRESERLNRRKNLDKLRERNRRRRAIKRNASAILTVEQWQACLEYFHHTCVYCGAQQDFWHVLEQEHFIPLSSGGEHTIRNTVPACKSCNSSKRDTHPQEWLARKHSKRKAAEILARIEAYFVSLK